MKIHPSFFSIAASLLMIAVSGCGGGDTSASGGSTTSSGGTGGTTNSGGTGGTTSGGGTGGELSCTGVMCDGMCTDTTVDPANCGSCGHACDGTCLDSLCTPTKLGGGSKEIAVDANNLYFIQGTVLYSAALSGGQPVMMWSNPATPPKGLGAAGGYVFFSDNSNSVLRIPAAGGAAETVANMLDVVELTLDSTHVYWRTNTGLFIARAPQSGGGAQTLTSITAAGLAVDGTHVYFTGFNDVERLPKAGGQVEVLVTGQGGPRGIAVDAASVYWVASTDGTVNKAPVAGGAAVALATGESEPTGIAVDATHVYWTSHGNGTVKKAPLAGGETTLVAKGYAGANRIVLDDGHVYFSSTSGIFRVVK